MTKTATHGATLHHLTGRVVVGRSHQAVNDKRAVAVAG